MTKVEGTIMLEGLVEGPLPPFPDASAKLEKWAQAAFHAKIPASLQIDGNHFSALPANHPVAVESLSGENSDPSITIADTLADLLRYFPPLERSQVFSTLRSIEWDHNIEIRTLYAIGPDGRIATRQEKVPCETTPPALPLSPRQMATRIATGLLVALAVLGISSFFISYPKLWRQLTASVEPAKVSLNDGYFQPYFTLEVKGLDRRNGTLLIRLTRTKNFPLTDQEIDNLYDHPIPPAPPTPATTRAAPTTATSAPAPATTAATIATTAATAPATLPTPSLLKQKLAIESLARGLVRLEARDDQGRLIAQTTLKISDLQSFDMVDTTIPAPIIEEKYVIPTSIDILP